ncbi:MAG: methyltransferase [Aigarchaeota archaeon]|nr:methyltransferase [Aigarchaeota archaeon]MCX8193546.1 methyltransferase [Nitrososphaeria archaeon]MDW7986686.1 methyltransferase [Nitrososphaerota archaeon]
MKNTRRFYIRDFEIELLIDSKVYKPSFTSMLIARNIPDLDGLDVLDIGTGSGILSIIASRLNARRIIATDISVRALNNAYENFKINNVWNVELRLGSVFEPVEDEEFDIIISNPPMTPSHQPLPRYTWGGLDGRWVLDEIIRGAPKHLKNGGRLIIPTISLVGIEKTYRLLRDIGFKIRVLDYGYHPFSRRLMNLKKYIDRLDCADYFYDNHGRPCWRVVLYEATMLKHH